MILDAEKKNHVIASQRARWRGNPPDLSAFSLEIVTFYHSTGGLPRPFGPRNDVVIYTFKQQFIIQNGIKKNRSVDTERFC